MSDSEQDLNKRQDAPGSTGDDVQPDPFLRRLKTLVLIMSLVMIAGMAFVATSITKMISSHQKTEAVSWQNVPDELVVNYADFGLNETLVRPLDIRGQGRFLHVWRIGSPTQQGAFLVLDLQTKTIAKTIRLKTK